MMHTLRTLRHPWIVVLLNVVCAAALLLAPAISHGATPANTAASRAAGATPGASRDPWADGGAWFQRMIYLYASGNAPIQREALAAGARAGLSSAQVTAVSQAVRAAWLRMMREDPATLGRTGVTRNPAGQGRVLAALRAQLRGIAGSRYAELLAATDSTYAQATAPAWLAAHGIQVGAPAASTSGSTILSGYVSVYATSFQITGSSITLANGTMFPLTNPYVALPDAYLKFTNLGLYSNIASIYQPYYVGNSGTGGYYRIYTVDIANSSGQQVLGQVLIADVGPWNEDDNWWDPPDPNNTIPSGCPVTTQPVSQSSFSNAQVDGICPGPWNWRRTAYYLLYQHGGLPFFQTGFYQPTGSYADTTAWPPLMPTYCPEASLASVNEDNAPCAVGLRGYNVNAGDWLRNGSYFGNGTANGPILNQSGIDLSPAVDTALGWTWPSSGFIRVNIERLPSGLTVPRAQPHG